MERTMSEDYDERQALAGYVSTRREAILEAWRAAIKCDPTLTTGDSLPRSQLYDHIPALLATFERVLGQPTGGLHPVVSDTAQRSARPRIAALAARLRFAGGHARTRKTQ